MLKTLKTSTEAVGLLCMIIIFMLLLIMLLLGTIVDWFQRRKLRRGKWVGLSDGVNEKEEVDVGDDTAKEEWLGVEMDARKSVCTVVRQPISPITQLPEGHYLASASSWMSRTGSRKEEMSRAVLNSQHQSLNLPASVSAPTKVQSIPWTPKNNPDAMLSCLQSEVHTSSPMPPPPAASFRNLEAHGLHPSRLTSPFSQSSAAPVTKLLPLPPHTPPRTPIKDIFSSPLRSPETPALRLTPSTTSLPLYAIRKFRPFPPLPIITTKHKGMESTKAEEGWMKEVGVVRHSDKPMMLQTQAQSQVPVYFQRRDESQGMGLLFGRALPLRKAQAKGVVTTWTPRSNLSSSPIHSPPTLVFDSTTSSPTRSTPLTKLQHSQTSFTPRTPNTVQTPTAPQSATPDTYTSPTPPATSSTPQPHDQDLYFLPLASPTSSAWNSPTRPIFFSPSMTPPIALSPPLLQNHCRTPKQELYMKPVPPIPSITRGSKYEEMAGSGFSPLPLPLRPRTTTNVPSKLLSSPSPPTPPRMQIPRKPLPITKQPTAVIVPPKTTTTSTQPQPVSKHKSDSEEEWQQQQQQQRRRRSEVTFLEEDWSDLEITPEEEEEEEEGDVELGLGKRGMVIRYPKVPRSAVMGVCMGRCVGW